MVYLSVRYSLFKKLLKSNNTYANYEKLKDGGET